MIDEKKLIKQLEKHGLSTNPVKAYEEIIDIINQMPKIDWIPCEERLPECEWGCETKALMFQIKNSDYIEIGYYGEGGKYRDRYFRTYTDTLEGFEISDVIAWQPLPQPYKKDRSGEVAEKVKPAWKERLMNTFLGGRE